MLIRRLYAKKGHVIVETAIFLPLFIIAVITIACIVRGVSMSETLMHSISSQGRKLAVEGYIKEQGYDLFLGKDGEEKSDNLKKAAVEWIQQEGFYFRVKNQIEKDVGSQVQDLDLTEFKNAYTQDHRDGLIKISFRYTLPIPVPRIFDSEINLQETVLLRAFIGRSDIGEKKSFSEMEETEELQTVYVFPRAGERYHGSQCRVLRKSAQRAILSAKTKKRYKPCKLCHPDSLALGSSIYIFKDSGEVYHRKSCTSIELFFIPMEKAEAESNGYTACQICGGKAK